MVWAYGCPWYGDFPRLDGDPLFNKLKLLKSWGLNGTGIELGAVDAMNDEYREKVGAFLAENDMHLRPGVWYDYLNTPHDEAQRCADDLAEKLGKYRDLLRARACITKAGRPAHRFDRSMPLDVRLERLSRAIAPLSQACWDLDVPVGINNQGDFYCSDLVELCEQTPHLYIYLDTSNVHWVGEQALPAFQVAAPYVVGTHWRDEYVHPGLTKPQRVELSGAVIGEGDVPLRECYDLILRHSPFVDRMMMEIELIRPNGMDTNECLKKSLEHVRSLPVPQEVAA